MIHYTRINRFVYTRGCLHWAHDDPWCSNFYMPRAPWDTPQGSLGVALRLLGSNLMSLPLWKNQKNTEDHKVGKRPFNAITIRQRASSGILLLRLLHWKAACQPYGPEWLFFSSIRGHLACMHVFFCCHNVIPTLWLRIWRFPQVLEGKMTGS